MSYAKLSGEVKHILPTARSLSGSHSLLRAPLTTTLARAQIKPHTAEAEHVKLLALSRSILHLYPTDDVQAWFVSLFPVGGGYGVTTAKLRRVPQSAWYLSQQTIDTGLTWLREGVPAQQALVRPPLLFPPHSALLLVLSERVECPRGCADLASFRNSPRSTFSSTRLTGRRRPSRSATPSSIAASTTSCTCTRRRVSTSTSREPGAPPTSSKCARSASMRMRSSASSGASTSLYKPRRSSLHEHGSSRRALAMRRRSACRNSRTLCVPLSVSPSSRRPALIRGRSYRLASSTWRPGTMQ